MVNLSKFNSQMGFRRSKESNLFVVILARMLKAKFARRLQGQIQYNNKNIIIVS